MGGQIMIFSVILLACAGPVLNFSLGNVDTGKNGVSICKEGICGSISNRYFRRVFKGLFHSRIELSLFDKVNNKIINIPVLKDAPHTSADNPSADDGAICCSTHVEHLNKTKMTNIAGEERYILHINDAENPQFQYIPHARCVRNGSCPGTCAIETKILHLLTFRNSAEGTVIEFDSFPVPGYCSCKNFGGAR